MNVVDFLTKDWKRTFVSVTALIILASIGRANAEECPKGAIYRISESPHTLLVKRIGVGKSNFTQNGPPQTGIAIDLVTSEGQQGAIFGPMRSYMFMVENAGVLTSEGYKWEPAQADPGGFFRVLSDDGQKELFYLTYIKCYS